jgi:hypothetical protein
MTAAQGLITVRLQPLAEREEEFHDWYNTEHIPQVMSLPGFAGARRYRCDTDAIPFIAWYETADEHVESGPHFQRIVQQPTEWSQRMRHIYGDRRERMNFKLMCEVANTANTGPVTDAPWMYLVHTDIPDHIVGEYNAWYDKEHLPRCAAIPGVLRARRYTAAACTSGTVAPRYLTAYEMTGPDIWESPAAQQARKTPWTEKMRSLFSNTRRSLCQLIAPTVTHAQAVKINRK